MPVILSSVFHTAGSHTAALVAVPFFWPWLFSIPFLNSASRVELLAKLVSWLDTPHPLLEAMNSVNLGIGGDRPRHLLWRIRNGELDAISPRLRNVICLIGINEFIMNDGGPQEATAGIVACARELDVRLPKGVSIMMHALLPVRWSREKLDRLSETNKATQRELSRVCSARVRFVDCGDVLRDVNGEFDQALFTDDVHPNEAGYQLWGQAMMSLVKDDRAATVCTCGQTNDAQAG